MAEKSQKIIEFLQKYDAIFIFGSRFIYGIRNFSPVAIGIAGIHPLKFSTFNIPAALIWSVLVASAGYLFSDAVDAVKEHMHIVEIFALAILCIGLGIFLLKRKRKKAKLR